MREKQVHMSDIVVLERSDEVYAIIGTACTHCILNTEVGENSSI